MENRSDAPAPIHDPSPLDGCDYQPPEATNQPQSSDDPAAGSRPPGSFDPNAYPPRNGEPQL